MKIEKIVYRFAWLIIAIAAIVLSTWSLYELARHLGVPAPLAALVSTAFDGGAIFASLMAMRWARVHGSSGLFSRVCMFLFLGASVYLNIQHAIILGLPYAARILFAMPAVIALASIENHLRFAHRGSLRRAGRIPESLPGISRWAWILFPFRTYGVVRRIVEFRLSSLAARSGVPSSSLSSGEFDELTTTRSVVQQHSTTVTETVTISPRTVRAWARTQGLPVAEKGPIPGEIVTAYRREIESPGTVTPGNVVSSETVSPENPDG